MIIKLTPWQLYNLVLNGNPIDVDDDQVWDIKMSSHCIEDIQILGYEDARVQDFLHYTILNRLLSPLDLKIDTGDRLYGFRKKVEQTPDHELILKK